jgi:hypothetical protein
MSEYEAANYTEHWALADAVILHTSKQQRRLIRYLLSHQKAVTVDVNRACAIGNISDVASKANKELHRVGLFIGCNTPATPIPNSFDKASQMFLWSVVVMPNAEHLIEQFNQMSTYKKAVPD